METTNTKTSLILNDRNTLSLTGVKKIRSTEPTQVVAVLDNCQVIIQGSNLSVQNVNIPSGVLELTGQVNSIKYSGAAAARKFSLKNMFK